MKVLFIKMSRILLFLLIVLAPMVSAANVPACRGDPKALRYRGTLSQTVSGRTCQKWSAQSPQKHSMTPSSYSNAGIGDHNYCRNPTGRAFTGWCLTTDPNKRWEFCAVGRLAQDCKSAYGFPIAFAPQSSGNAPPCTRDLNGYSYRGTLSHTVSGRRCQRWNSLSPHKPAFKYTEKLRYGLGQHNYCRNPDRKNGAWCYTTDPKVRWEYCAIGKYAPGCYTRPGELRLAGDGSDTHQGRLEYYSLKWGTIYGLKFPMTSGNVACRQLGFPQGALNVYPTAEKFGEGSGRVYTSQVECKGYESFLDQCPNKGSMSDVHSKDVGVECKGSLENVRLAGLGKSEASVKAGRVEVLHRGKWGTVCGDGFDQNDADAVCRTLGFFQGAHQFGRAQNTGIGFIWIGDLRCKGIEDRLSECRSGIPFGSNTQCTHYQDVYVSCKGDRAFKSDLVPLGMESGAIPDSSITASSSYSSNHGPARARLNTVQEGTKKGSWCSKTKDTKQWIQVDLSTPKRLIAVATQARQDMKQAVKTYKIACSMNGVTFENIKTLEGDKDKIFKFEYKGIITQNVNTIVTNFLPRPRVCRYVRLLPQTWFGHISLRMELYGDSNVAERGEQVEEELDTYYQRVTGLEDGWEEDLDKKAENMDMEDMELRGLLDLLLDEERELGLEDTWMEEFDEKNEDLYIEDMEEREEETQEEERGEEMDEERELEGDETHEKELVGGLMELLQILDSK